MTALVTGAGGFLGTRIVWALSARGIDVRCHVRTPSSEAKIRRTVTPPPGHSIEYMGGNLLSPTDCARLVTGCDIVVHAAAAKSGSASVMFLNTVSTTRTLAAAAIANGTKRFVLVSSLGVYGTADLRAGDALTEDCPLEPTPERRDAYSFAKLAQERVAWEAHAKGLPLVVIRPGVIYGPGGDLLSARVGLRFGQLMVRMGGSQRLPYVYVDNCAEAIAQAATVPGIEGRYFNVLDDELPTGRMLLSEYRREVSPLRVVPIPLRAIPFVARAYEAYCRRTQDMIPPILTRYRCYAQWKRLQFPNTRARQELGWTPTVTLRDGVARTVESLRLP